MICPLRDMVLVLPSKDEEGMVNGVFLPKPQEQSIMTAKVVRVGEEAKVKENDVILIAKASGLSMYVNGERHVMMPASQILATVT